MNEKVKDFLKEIYSFSLQYHVTTSLLESRNKIIKFESRKDEINGFYELLVAKTPIRSAGEHRFIISNEQCNLLQTKNISYNVISEI